MRRDARNAAKSTEKGVDMLDSSEAKIGRFRMTPVGPFEAGAFVTITFHIEIGEVGVNPGGHIKIGTPNMGWGQPLVRTPRVPPELLVNKPKEHNPWKPINTTVTLKTAGRAVLAVRAAEEALMARYESEEMNRIAREYRQWRWWITLTVERDALRPGDEIAVVYGDTAEHSHGVRVPPWYESDPDTFAALIDVEGDGEYREPIGSPVVVHLAPAPPERTVAVLPSLAVSGERLPVRMAVLDRNLCPPSAPFVGPVAWSGSGVLGDAHGQVVLPAEISAAAAGPGVGRVTVRGPDTARSNPVLITSDRDLRIFWGDLHAQSRYHQWNPAIQRGDSCNTPRELHQYARDAAMLDFVAITDGGGAFREEGWLAVQEAAVDCYEPGRYVPLKGWEYQVGKQGDKCVVYRSAEIEPPLSPQVLQAKDPTSFHSLIRFYRNRPQRVLTIPHSFMKYMDWSVTDPELDRVMEVYSTWGSYESRHDNPLNSKRRPRNQSAQHAWRSGLLLGITAAGDSHIGYPGRSIPYGDRYWCQCFKAGLCAVCAPELTREAVWDALYNRRCYGTTGVRIILQFQINGAMMGSVLEYTPSDSRLARRRIRVRVVGTDFIRRVDVLRNNAVLHREVPESDEADFAFEDVLERPPATRDWYYVRVFQADGNAAWSSPIWVGACGVTQPTPTELE